MAVVAGPEFPLLGNQMLHVAVRLEPRPGETEMRFAIIPLGRSLGRFVTLPVGARIFVHLAGRRRRGARRTGSFPGRSVAHCAAFRITRNADLSIRDDIAHDLMAEIEEILDERKLGDCVRLELSADADPETVAFLRAGTRRRRGRYLRASRPARSGRLHAAGRPATASRT